MTALKRGSIPEPALMDREPDQDVLGYGAHGPFPPTQNSMDLSFERVHPNLREILIRMDRQEIAMFNQGVRLLTSLEQADLDRFRLSLKVFGAVLLIWRGIKWAVLAFLAGLAAVSVAGEQIQKVGGWVLKLMMIFRGGGQ